MWSWSLQGDVASGPGDEVDVLLGKLLQPAPVGAEGTCLVDPQLSHPQKPLRGPFVLG